MTAAASQPLRQMADTFPPPLRRHTALVVMLVLAGAAVVLVACSRQSSALSRPAVLAEDLGASYKTVEEAMAAAVAAKRAAKAARRKLEQLAVERVDRELNRESDGRRRAPVESDLSTHLSMRAQAHVRHARRAYRQAKGDDEMSEVDKLKGYLGQMLDFTPKKKSISPEEAQKENKELREDPDVKYRYRPRRRPYSARSQGQWEHDEHGRRYWKPSTKPMPLRTRQEPRDGGRWPLRDRRGLNRYGGIWPSRDRGPRDPYMKYSHVPQHFPHKGLADLGDNWISGFGSSADDVNSDSPFADRYRRRPYPFSSSRAPRIFRGFGGGGRYGRSRIRSPPRGRWRRDKRGRRRWERGHYKRKPGKWVRNPRTRRREYQRGPYVRKNGKRVWVPSSRHPHSHSRRYRDPITQKRYPRYHNPDHSRVWPNARNARRGVWKRVPGTGRYRTRNGKRTWVPSRRYYRPYTKSPYNRDGSRDLRSPYWNRHHRRQRLKPVMQRLNRGKIPRSFWKSRYVPREKYQKQFHPHFAKGETRPARRDRFRPLSKYPNRFKPRDTRDPAAAKLNGPLTAAAGLGYVNGKPPPQAAGPVTGPKTDAEKDLLDGAGGKKDPFRTFHKALKDEEEPAEMVLQDIKDDQLNRAPGGEPLTDALQNSWDMHDGVADP